MQVLVFTFLITPDFKKSLKTTQNKKRYNKIVHLARSTLNSIENIISEVLINNKISLYNKTLQQLLMKKKNIEK